MAGGYLRRGQVLNMKPNGIPRNGSRQSAVGSPQPSPRLLQIVDRTTFPPLKEGEQVGVSFFGLLLQRLIPPQSPFFKGGWLSIFLFCISVVSWAVPPTPSGLSIAAPFDGEVNLVWTPDTNATPSVTAYLIYRQLVDLTNTPTPNPTGTPTPIATVLLSSITTPTTPGMPAYQDFQVTNGQNYLYQVQEEDQNGIGNPASVTAAPYLAPVAVQPVTVQNLHSNALDLSWGVPNSSYPVSYYQIFLYEYPTPTFTPNLGSTATFTPTGTLTPSPTPTFPTSPVPASTVLNATPLATVTITSYSDTTANSSGSPAFYYSVIAVDILGHVGAQPTYATTPALPMNMAPPAKPILSALVSLNATPVIGLNGYGARLFWTGSLSSEGVTVYQVLQNSTPIATINYPGPTPTMSYDDTTLPAGMNGSLSVNYQVAAVNAYGTGTSAGVPVAVNEASESTNIQVTPDATANAVTISWNPAVPGTYGLGGYRLYKSLFGVPTNNPTPIPPGSPTATVTPTPFATVSFNPSATFTITPYVDSPIVNHMSYWVEPVDLTTHGGAVNGASTPALNLAPTPPSNVGVANPVGNNQIAVSWTDGSAGFFGQPQDYVVYRVMLTSPTATPQAVATVPVSQLSYTDNVSGFPVGTGVAYQVGLVDAVGNTSDLSASGNSVVLAGLTAPAAPTVLPFAGSASSIRFAWLNNPPADNVTSYSVFGPDWPTLPQTPTPLATVLATQSPTPTLLFAPTPTPWAATYYYLLAQNALGTSTPGFSAPATLSGIPVPAYQVTVVMTPGTRQSQVSWNMTPAPVSTPVVDSFGIYRSLSPAANFTPVATVPSTGSSYVDTLPSATAAPSHRSAR